MSMHKRQRGAIAPPAQDDCVDADLYFGDGIADDGRHRRKADQLRVAVQRALIGALECDVNDPMVAGLALYDVVAEPGGSFAALFATERVEIVDALQARLRDAAPVFRTAMAHALTRKRVPTVSFYVVPAGRSGVDDG